MPTNNYLLIGQKRFMYLSPSSEFTDEHINNLTALDFSILKEGIDYRLLKKSDTKQVSELWDKCAEVRRQSKIDPAEPCVATLLNELPYGIIESDSLDAYGELAVLEDALSGATRKLLNKKPVKDVIYDLHNNELVVLDKEELMPVG